MENRYGSRGFTLMEAMLAVAVIAIISGLASIGVVHYLRGLEQLELDGLAREIFISAQNHLSLSESQGYPGIKQFGTEEDSTKGIYYYIMQNSAIVENDEQLFNQMLPLGSVDETVRLGGNYIIRYQKDPAQVLDVFYSKISGRFSASFNSISGDGYKDLLDNYRGDSQKRRDYSGNGNTRSVIGYYGGTKASEILSGTPLLEPKVEFLNGDRLLLKIEDQNTGNLRRTLIVSQGDKNKSFEIPHTEGVAYLVFDDVTDMKDSDANTLHFSESGLVASNSSFNSKEHFCNLFPDFVPGEDIRVKYAVENVDSFVLPVDASDTANSLFGGKKRNGTSVEISSFRHLENLDPAISGMDVSNVTIEKANQALKYDAKAKEPDQLEQGDIDLDWSSFLNKDVSGKEVTDLKITKKDGNALTGESKYYPVNLKAPLEFNGYRSQSGKIVGRILNVDIDSDTYGGLFGIVSTKLSVKDIQLINFNVKSSKENAGALIGSMKGTNVEYTIKNVMAFNDISDDSAIEISGLKSTGGLIGTVSEGAKLNLSKCGSAVYVKSTSENAGGLVGTINSTAIATVTSCYSGGHTSDGSYTGLMSGNARINVISNSTAGVVGGLIGGAGNAVITNCYSTCSVYGHTSGGFVGSSSGTITNCYSVGKVLNGTEEGTLAGAFIGNYSKSDLGILNCLYCESINDIKEVSTGKITYMPPLGSGNYFADSNITAIDKDANSYNVFVGSPSATWKTAVPYDGVLETYYQKKYNLKTVQQLRTTDQGNSVPIVGQKDFVYVHYGDWPAPEIFVFNTK